MKPKIKERFKVFGCLGLALIFVIVSIKDLIGPIRWPYWGAGVVLILVWGVVGNIRWRAKQKIERAALAEIFRRYGGPLPILKYGGSYGWPGFDLIFVSQEDLNAAVAAGCVDAFKTFIQSRYGHIAFGSRSFEVDRAVSVRWADKSSVAETQ